MIISNKQTFYYINRFSFMKANLYMFMFINIYYIMIHIIYFMYVFKNRDVMRFLPFLPVSEFFWFPYGY